MPQGEKLFGNENPFQQHSTLKRDCCHVFVYTELNVEDSTVASYGIHPPLLSITMT